jgi:hypothetical protein
MANIFRERVMSKGREYWIHQCHILTKISQSVKDGEVVFVKENCLWKVNLGRGYTNFMARFSWKGFAKGVGGEGNLSSTPDYDNM